MSADDRIARERIASSLDESLLVEAAAGTGKTTELVGRIVAVLASGRSTVDRIVAVTFTNKAAGELKLRLRQELDRTRLRERDPDRRRALTEALARLEEAHVGTIHSFCAELLRQRPVEARVDPAFRELDEAGATRLFESAFRSWIEERLESMPEPLRRALVRLADRWSPDGSSPIDQLRRAAGDLAEWRDHPAPWSRMEDLDRAGEIDRTVTAIEELAEIAHKCPDPHDNLYQALRPVTDFATWIRRSEAFAPRDHDAIEARLESTLSDLKRWFRKGRRREYAPDLLREEVLERRQALCDAVEVLQERLEADLVAALRDELRVAVDRYEVSKRRAGALDFLDLLLRARDLVRDEPGVRRDLQRRFTHFFVDELQDTDPVQLEILLLLAADDPEETDWRKVRPTPGKLFLVGDPKQSIYRFRRADVVLYRELERHLASVGVGVLHLSRSFRSVPEIQQTVNAAFRLRMTDDDRSGQPEYVPLEPHRDAPDSQPSVVVVPVPTPYGRYDSYYDKRIEESLPGAIAGFLDWLVGESGWTVEDPVRPGRRVAVRPRHVAVLFRRFVQWSSDVTLGLQRGLEERGVPHVLVGGRSFHEREEIVTLRAALRAIEWPDDELSVFATLRGSLFGIDDSLLLRYRQGIGALHPARPLPPDLATDFLPIASALGILGELHRQRNRIPVAATLRRLLEETRAAAGFALRPAGHQVLANVQRLADRARRFETGGGLSFRGFVEEIEDEAETGASDSGSILDDTEEGVRILTVHAAKGLEFPVVVLADPTCNEAPQQAYRVHDTGEGLYAARLLRWSPRELLERGELELERERAESVRLAYVAATRARDLLVVPGLGHGPRDKPGWLTALDPAIYPAPGAERQPSRWAPGCPRFGPTTVLLGGPVDAPTIQPGLHRPREGDHRVVWWDPALLQQLERSPPGLREERVLAPDPGGDATEEGLDRWDEWTARHEEAIEAGRRLSVDVRTPTGEEAIPDPPADLEVTEERVETRDRRPGGLRFGTLVHTLLRDADAATSPADLEELARLHGRLLDAPETEVRAAVPCVAGALAHPLVVRAFAAERRHRELPFQLPLDDAGLLLEGTIDLVFRDTDGWTVVDFKTDAEAGERSADYRRQAAWYAEAMRRTTGEPARAVLLRI